MPRLRLAVWRIPADGLLSFAVFKAVPPRQEGSPASAKILYRGRPPGLASQPRGRRCPAGPRPLHPAGVALRAPGSVRVGKAVGYQGIVAQTPGTAVGRPFAEGTAPSSITRETGILPRAAQRFRPGTARPRPESNDVQNLSASPSAPLGDVVAAAGAGSATAVGRARQA
ncbi:hypothetical protein GCM10023220_16410 [Streptomyces ziwulingensis]|uniref:Uncharacterized protein n=1 Tax=Streptomyces ziwulingensis TaxID=1045501 RepID=A0ABP9B768_9ACTN